MATAVKYCSVPSCENTSLKCANKIFVRIPIPQDVRDRWYKAINTPKVLKTTLAYVCEDHFNLEEDAENWMKYRLLGGNLSMKKNIVPHLNLLSNETDITKSQLTS